LQDMQGEKAYTHQF